MTIIITVGSADLKNKIRMEKNCNTGVLIMITEAMFVTPADQNHRKWEIEYCELNTYSLHTHNDEYFK